MDSRPPPDQRRGDPITAELLNRLKETSIQDIILVGGQVRRRGRQIILIPGSAVGGVTLYKATSDATGTSPNQTITVKEVDAEGNAVGAEITLGVLP